MRSTTVVDVVDDNVFNVLLLMVLSLLILMVFLLKWLGSKCEVEAVPNNPSKPNSPYNLNKSHNANSPQLCCKPSTHET